MHVEATPPEITLKDFFESCPPGKIVRVLELGIWNGSVGLAMAIPDIQLHCNSDACNGIRYFAVKKSYKLLPDRRSEHFIEFCCRNCNSKYKNYAVVASLDESDEKSGEVVKYGEHPPFGPPTPAKVIKLIGPEREYFLKGRRCENQGLGIAAFAYYRRVVENQKSRILEEIHRVASRIGASNEVLLELAEAQKEVQFSKAIGSIKHAIPQILLINGENPLILLHSALSEGLHATTDEECLELATSIRVVLTELVERMATALKEELELTTAVNRLMQANGKRK